MEKLKAKNSKLKTKLKNLKLYALSLSFALYALHFTLVATQPVYALDSTPSADQLRQSDSEASIKSKLEELKKEIASKAAKLKQEVDRKLKDKAYVGKVKSFSETSITLAASSGPKMVSINQDTVFEDKQNTSSKKAKGKAKFSAKTIAEDDFVAALGDTDETGVLIAKKVILLPVKNYQSKTPLWGQIISTGEKLITLRDKDFKNIAVSMLSSVKVSLNDFVILTGNIDKNEIFEASFVYVIPQGGIIKPKKIVYPAPNGAGATPSTQIATPSSKSATASGKSKPTTR